MTKDDLISHFGSAAEVARFLDVSRAAINQLPDQLSIKYQRQVIGALVIAGMDVPDAWIGQKPKRGANAH